MYARRNDELEIPARVRIWVRDTLVRLVKAREALDAVGRVSKVGRVRVLRVYERPYNITVLVSAYN
jgi:hypothetical protein